MAWEVSRSFKREGTYVYLWLIHVDVWQRPAQCCNYSSIKNKQIKKENPVQDVHYGYLFYWFFFVCLFFPDWGVELYLFRDLYTLLN